MLKLMDNLKGAHEVFCKEYVTHWSGVKAYQTAYPNSEYSTAKVNASKLLTNSNIQNYIEHIQKDLLELCGVSVLSNVTKLKEIINNEDAKDSDKIRALEVINKMIGISGVEKTETKLEDLRSTEPCSITFTRK
jgi:phage terminase small subunit